MSHELICTWLGLPPGDWPPDHYRLLGLEPGESDSPRIEQRVHDRLEAVRRYQVKHPDLVTEAMNRLAQAYVCLTDPDARAPTTPPAPAGRRPTAPNRSPPRRRRSGRAAPQPSRRPPGAPGAGAGSPAGAHPRRRPRCPRLPASGRPARPPPVRRPDGHTSPTPAPEPPVALPVDVAEALPAAPPPAPPQPRPKDDPVIEASRSPAARRGLGTRRALYQRLTATRRLMRAWERAGKYLGSPKRKLSKPAEATELINRLKAPARGAGRLPAPARRGGSAGLLGRGIGPPAGAGARVPDAAARPARDARPALEGRPAIPPGPPRVPAPGDAGDPQRGRLGRALRATRHAINDHAGAVLLLVLALFAIVAAIWRQYVHFDY